MRAAGDIEHHARGPVGTVGGQESHGLGDILVSFLHAGRDRVKLVLGLVDAVAKICRQCGERRQWRRPVEQFRRCFLAPEERHQEWKIVG